MYIEPPVVSSILGQQDLGSLHIQELWQRIPEDYDYYLLYICISVFAPYVYIEISLGISRRELHFLDMVFEFLDYSGAMAKKN